MKVHGAKASDAKAIHALVNCYAEREQMLFRPMADIYKNLQTFFVVEIDGLEGLEIAGVAREHAGVHQDAGVPARRAVGVGLARRGEGVGAGLAVLIGQARGAVGIAAVVAVGVGFASVPGVPTLEEGADVFVEARPIRRGHP